MANSDFLSSETFLNIYRKKLKEAADRETRYMTTAVSSHEEYAERVGFLRGIEEALAIFNDVEKQFFPKY